MKQATIWKVTCVSLSFSYLNAETDQLSVPCEAIEYCDTDFYPDNGTGIASIRIKAHLKAHGVTSDVIKGRQPTSIDFVDTFGNSQRFALSGHCNMPKANLLELELLQSR